MTDEEAKLLLTRIDERTQQLVLRRDDHEERLRVIEKLVWVASGAAAIVGTFLSYLLRKLGLA